MIMFRSIIVRIRNISDKVWGEAQNTHFMFNNVFPKNCLSWENVEKCGRVAHATDVNTIQRMGSACRISKATDTRCAVPQIGRLLVRFQLVSLEIFYWHKILPIALWPWGRLSLYQKWVPGAFPGGKSGRCVRLTNLPPSCAVVMKSGNFNFLEPSGPLRACKGTDLPLPFYRYTLRKLNFFAFPRKQCLRQRSYVLQLYLVYCLSGIFFKKGKKLITVSRNNKFSEKH